MKYFLRFLKQIFEGNVNRCSVINCRKEITDNNFKVIDGQIFCIECATIFYTNFIKGFSQRQY
ncbi:MAG: hypothetical protein ACTSQO_10850 [Candidatus Helarchaeota archaeon]